MDRQQLTLALRQRNQKSRRENLRRKKQRVLLAQLLKPRNDKRWGNLPESLGALLGVALVEAFFPSKHVHSCCHCDCN